MDVLGFGVLLALGVAVLALIRRNMQNGPKTPPEGGAPDAPSAPSAEGDVRWRLLQEELSQMPPIDQADALIMPPVDDALIEQEIEEPPLPPQEAVPPLETRPVGGWLPAFFVYGVIQLIGDGFTVLRYLSALVSPSVRAASSVGLLWYLALLLALAVADLIVTIWWLRLLLRRNILFRKVVTIRLAVPTGMFVCTLIASALLGRDRPALNSTSFVVSWLLVLYLYRSKRVRYTCGIDSDGRSCPRADR